MHFSQLTQDILKKYQDYGWPLWAIPLILWYKSLSVEWGCYQKTFEKQAQERARGLNCDPPPVSCDCSSKSLSFLT
jgi:hypothetical protein